MDGRLRIQKKFSLGSDPEMFVFSGNKLMPAFQFLPPKGKDVKLYWDGFQAEWKYDHYGNQCLNTLVMCTRQNMINLRERALVHDKDARLSLVNVVRIPRETLEQAEGQHVELGCLPSYNAYGLRGEDVPNPRTLPFRFAGGHMHFGSWTRKPQYKRIVETLDRVLGVWAVGAARHMDNPVRRRYYGLPGEFRKPMYANLKYNPYTGRVDEVGQQHGVEYRTLSNFWLASPGIMQLTWDLGRMCVRIAQSLKYNNLWVSTQDETVDVIKNCDYERATQIIKRNEPMLRWMLGQEYRRPASIERAIDISKQGIEVVVPNPEAIPQNWHFTDVWLEDAHQPWSRWETCEK